MDRLSSLPSLVVRILRHIFLSLPPFFFFFPSFTSHTYFIVHIKILSLAPYLSVHLTIGVLILLFLYLLVLVSRLLFSVFFFRLYHFYFNFCPGHALENINDTSILNPVSFSVSVPVGWFGLVGWSVGRLVGWLSAFSCLFFFLFILTILGDGCSSSVGGRIRTVLVTLWKPFIFYFSSDCHTQLQLNLNQRHNSTEYMGAGGGGRGDIEVHIALEYDRRLS